MNILQNIIFPHFAFRAPQEMYCRLHNHRVYTLAKDKKLVFCPQGIASFDTFFNSISIQNWKKNCQINDLSLCLQGKGQFLVRIGLHRIGYAHTWLDEHIINLSEEQPEIALNIQDWANLKTGMLYFSVQALSDGELNKGYWATQTPAPHSVKLGIVITHFNRKQWVLPAIKRIHDELLTDPSFKNKIELIVVDNSQNITPAELDGYANDGITIIPNRNLGGSGGFTRGLLHLKDQHDFTHCLFMDDDASCEIDGIKRTYQLLSYRKNNNLAIAGSLLRETEPFRLHEKGARFDGNYHPLKIGMDMCHIQDLLFAELEDKSPNYGGWWFFAFAIDQMRHYPFPFFVRGDDILFSLINPFSIVTMNGIACWGEDFSYKESPLLRYLVSRATLLLMLTQTDFSFQKIKKTLNPWFRGQVYSYNYASAQAIIKAIEDVMKGPQFFEDNLDTTRIRQEITAFSEPEKMRKIERTQYQIVYRHHHKKEKKAHKIWRAITLNGFLLPSFMLKKANQAVFQHKSFAGNYREVFRFQHILYEYEPEHLGYVATHDKKAFFQNCLAYFQTLRRLQSNLNDLRSSYLQAMPHLTSEAFWREVHRDESQQ